MSTRAYPIPAAPVTVERPGAANLDPLILDAVHILGQPQSFRGGLIAMPGAAAAVTVKSLCMKGLDRKTRPRATPTRAN